MFSPLLQFAQLNNGSIAPDFTITDINGSSWNLYSILAQGKNVVLDFSTTWCTPCWAYHNTHELENFYTHYGPTGTIQPNKAMVFFIESDIQTTLNDLNGTGNNTKGNWLNGTPYPVCNPTTSAVPDAYQVSAYPTLYMVCSDKKVVQLSTPTEAQLLAIMSLNCPAQTYALDLGIVALVNTTVCNSSFPPIVSVKNNGSTSINSCTFSYSLNGGTNQVYTWTGNLAAAQSTSVTLPLITSVGSGNQTLQVSISNINGSNDQNPANNTGSYQVNINMTGGLTLPFNEGFASSGFPASGWTIANPDNGLTWARSGSFGGFGLSNSSAYINAYNYTTKGQTDELILPPFNLSGANNPVFTFDLAYGLLFGAMDEEKLEVLASADCGTTWVSIYEKSGQVLSTANAGLFEFTPLASQWRKETIALSSYSGQNKVFIKLRFTNNNGNNLYVDNFNLSNSSDIQKHETSKGVQNVFPIPAHDQVFASIAVEKEETLWVRCYDLKGSCVQTELFSLNKGIQEISFDTHALAAGVYVLEFVANSFFNKEKLIIK